MIAVVFVLTRGSGVDWYDIGLAAWIGGSITLVVSKLLRERASTREERVNVWTDQLIS
ncbi:hypothetical protein R3Q06_16335 [Rhodococcus erythropolis]|uniref:hypothetical protein n=1 Tax=Rhodococcus erythropolis TaxID=1833 RepID=UPI002949F9B7|nr:hypothetical protein [Rhodococcus erythropolis]MDV6275070.1 hypothetical protein [Rhodococcus erythropolis]